MAKNLWVCICYHLFVTLLLVLDLQEVSIDLKIHVKQFQLESEMPC